MEQGIDKHDASGAGARAADGPPTLPGRIGPYRIAGRLGTGGMGVVYRAWDERLERWVAIKHMQPRVAAAAMPWERFRREARAAASLNHPAIVRIYDILERDEGDCIVMELVAGRPLRDLLKEGPLDVLQAVRLAQEIVAGLAAAHAQGVVHRDLKVENIMVTPGGEAKILDFGLAKHLRKGGDSDVRTGSSALLGTSRVMSPEQILGQPIDGRSDLFSLGILLYEVLTGHSPFRGTTAIGTMARVCNQRQTPARELNPKIPAELSQLIDRLLAKEPAGRPRSAEEVAIALDRFLEPSSAFRLRGAAAVSEPAAPDRDRVPPGAEDGAPSELADALLVGTLVCISLVGQDRFSRRLGETGAYEVLLRFDRLTRDLLAQFGGLEIRKGEGFLLLFERSADAVEYALAYHERLAALAEEMGVDLRARAAIHRARVVRRLDAGKNADGESGRFQVDSDDDLVVNRLNTIALGGQTLLNREMLAASRRDLAGRPAAGRQLRWLEHGSYRIPGRQEEVQVCEVGRIGVAPLTPPPVLVRPRRLLLRCLLAGTALVVVLGLVAGYWLGLYSRPPELRASVAVLGFANQSGREEDQWLATALRELIATELAAGGHWRMIAGEAVARMLKELSLEPAGELSDDDLARVRRNLDADFVVTGFYRVDKRDGEELIHLHPVLQSTLSGTMLADLHESEAQTELFELVSRVGTTLRERLGGAEPSPAQTEAARATLPSSPEAIRSYSEGLALLRNYEALAARQVLEKAIAADPGNALAYAALSQAHAALGYELKARESAAQAVELAQDLPREELLSIQGRYHEAASEWPEAVVAYQTLWGMFPDRVDYGIRLANAQTANGHGEQALATIEQLRALPPPASDDPHIDLAEEAAARLRSEFDRGLKAAERAAAKAEDRDAWILVAEAKLRQGWQLRRLGRPEEAADAIETAEALFLDAGDRGKVAEALFMRGLLSENTGNGAQAEELYNRALDVHHQTRSRKGILNPLIGLVALWRERGELTTAKAKCEEALAAAREVGAQRHEAAILLALAVVILDQGDPVAARQLANDALGISDRICSRELSGWAYSVLAEIALSAGEVGNAKVLNRQAVVVSQEIGFPRMTAHVRQRQAQALLASGELAEAQRQAVECRRAREALGELGSLIEIDLIRAQIARAAGSRSEAERQAREVASEFGQRQLFDYQAEATLVVVWAQLAGGNVAAAREALEPARRRAATSQKPALRLAVEILHARVLAAAGEVEEALATLERVRTEAQQRGLAQPELEARLARGEIDKAPKAHDRLEALAAEATKKGFGLIARQARAAMGG